MSHSLNSHIIQLPSISGKKIVLSILAILLLPSLSMFFGLLGMSLSNQVFENALGSTNQMPTFFEHWNFYTYFTLGATLFDTLVIVAFWVLRIYYPQFLLNLLGKVQNVIQSQRTKSIAINVLTWVIFPMVLLLIPGGIFIAFGLLFFRK